MKTLEIFWTEERQNWQGAHGR